MIEVFSKAGAYIAIIILGYVLKKQGVFTLSAFSVLSTIVVRITLPAAIVANFTQINITGSLLLIILVGIIVNAIMIIVILIVNRTKPVEEQAFGILNLTGHNIGNFTLPFVQSFLGPLGFAAASLFDVGNAIMCLGVTPIMSRGMVEKVKSYNIVTIVRIFFSSYAFVAYVTMTVLGLLQIRLPNIVLLFAETAGGANSFIALLMLGIGFEIHLERAKLFIISKILIIRYVLSLLFCVTVYFVLPLELEIRQALVMVLLGPVASIAPVYTEQLKLDVELASAINSLTIVISVVLITCALVILL